MHSVTQDMRYRQSLLEYAQKYGFSWQRVGVDLEEHSTEGPRYPSRER